ISGFSPFSFGPPLLFYGVPLSSLPPFPSVNLYLLSVFSVSSCSSVWHLHHAMDSDEREICLYLKGWPGQFVSVAEITRRAGGKRRGRQDPNWAVPVLTRLVEKGILEADSTGHYRLIPRNRK